MVCSPYEAFFLAFARLGLLEWGIRRLLVKIELETIPVWDGLRSGSECFICDLMAVAGEDALNYYLGPAIMVPEIRVEINRKGFCPTHFQALAEKNKAQSLSLVLDTYMNESTGELYPMLERIGECTSARKGQKLYAQLGEWVAKREKGCLVCDYMDQRLERYVRTVAALYRDDAEFAKALAEGKGFCIHHTLEIARTAHEELSGDRLADYFGVHTGETKAYQGFMHPEGDHRYYGATGFWINCHKVMNGNTGLAVTCGRYDDCAVRFDPQTGYLLNPRTGDVQYDNGKGSFVLWDGTQWTPVQQNDFTWSFDYGKYLEAWDLPAPQFMGEMLGLNDFRGDMNADFTEWNERIETMKRSYLEAVPDGKFMILIPCSTCGSMNNDSGAFTLQQNAAMWRLRKNIIDTFDNREDEGFYLVDVALAIDNEDGYRKNENGVQTGNPHPYLSYPAMGVPIAAFIQYHR